MRVLISRCEAFILSKLGRCATCMRQSLMAAAGAWAVFAVGATMGMSGIAQNLIGLSALLLSGLWLAHVVTYAIRTLNETRGDQSRLVVAAPAEGDATPIGRRRAIGTLLRAASAGAVASVPVVLWSSESHAFCGQCTKQADCGSGFVCKNTAPVNSGRVCNECVRG